MSARQLPPSSEGRPGLFRPVFTPDPDRPPDPFEHSYPPWLTTGIVGAVAGAAVGGLIVFIVVGHSFLRPHPLPSAATVVPPSSGPIAVAKPGVLGPIVLGTNGRFDARGVAFEYPNAWVDMTRVVPANMPHGRVEWNAVLGEGLPAFAVVAAYPDRDPGTPRARSRAVAAVAQDVAGQLGATYASHPSPIGGVALPTFSYSLSGTPLAGGISYRLDAFVLFGARTRYVIQCQVVGQDPTDFSRGCAQIAFSFREVVPSTGSTAPLDAARRLYAAWRAGDEADAHRTATTDAVSQLFLIGPTHPAQPPGSCVSSGIVGVVACSPVHPNAQWLEFLVERFGSTYLVTQTLWCTTEGGLGRCSSFAP